MSIMNHTYAIAQGYRGLKEYPGAKHNREIVRFFKESGAAWVTDDETPWCAAFVGACLGEAGLPNTGKLNARSYCKWGVDIKPSDALCGDVVVLWRGNPKGRLGHVGFFAGWSENGEVRILGGNQGDEVNVAPYPPTRILAIRRARPKKGGDLHKSTTLRATGVSVASVGTATVTAGETISTLSTTSQVIIIGCVALVVCSLIWIARERIRKWANGDD